jgi:Fur family iron response transcriptional regulator
LREVVIDGGQVYFDTNIGEHFHVFDEDTGRLTDIPAHGVEVSRLPELPPGMVLSRVDVVLRVRAAK